MMQREHLPGLAAGCVVAGMHKLYRYRDHWWYDNCAHLLAGYTVGSALIEVSDEPDRRQVCSRFLAITSGWELFEYKIGEFPWNGEACWDHACEDTLLDTIMGLAGAWLACRHRRID